jgi:hypothetical protein
MFWTIEGRYNGEQWVRQDDRSGHPCVLTEGYARQRVEELNNDGGGTSVEFQAVALAEWIKAPESIGFKCELLRWHDGSVTRVRVAPSERRRRYYVDEYHQAAKRAWTAAGRPESSLSLEPTFDEDGAATYYGLPYDDEYEAGFVRRLHGSSDE